VTTIGVDLLKREMLEATKIQIRSCVIEDLVFSAKKTQRGRPSDAEGLDGSDCTSGSKKNPAKYSVSESGENLQRAHRDTL
jgi:hypothetical protein